MRNSECNGLRGDRINQWNRKNVLLTKLWWLDRNLKITTALGTGGLFNRHASKWRPVLLLKSVKNTKSILSSIDNSFRKIRVMKELVEYLRTNVKLVYSLVSWMIQRLNFIPNIFGVKEIEVIMPFTIAESLFTFPYEVWKCFSSRNNFLHASQFIVTTFLSKCVALDKALAKYRFILGVNSLIPRWNCSVRDQLLKGHWDENMDPWLE